jgi:hypothetical protein
MSKNEILEKLQDKRSKCIVYTRVMGYHRPVESFNIGKTGEHKQRKQFVETANCKWFNYLYPSWLPRSSIMYSLVYRV